MRFYLWRGNGTREDLQSPSPARGARTRLFLGRDHLERVGASLVGFNVTCRVSRKGPFA
jgi:hypothetical protein